MPTPGLSLLGFLNQAAAVGYLQKTCVPSPVAAPQDLVSEWQKAQARLERGNPAVAAPGQPDIQLLPAAAREYEAELRQQKWVRDVLADFGPSARFAMVEVDPLLAMQFHIDTDRAGERSAGLGRPPALSELLKLCLPFVPPALPPTVLLRQEGALLLKSAAHDFGPRRYGLFQGADNVAGVAVGTPPPGVAVARLNGRYYLCNGFHRAYGARLAGATAIPCIVRDVPHAATIGIQEGETFALSLLESADPPTLAHFTGGRAFEVRLRRHVRVMTVSWTSFLMPEE